MAQVRAFVGHSFSSEDSNVVGKYEKYLNQISLLHPLFSWEHAEVAEPRVIDEKVLRLFDGKDLFIGICTKKERVIKPSALKRALFNRDRVVAEDQDFEWKTSDWIIQEIGLAIGRGIPVLLLVEEGLRSPGTLQGNLEHIEFDRSAPEQSFGKLMEMISAFSPKSSAVPYVDTDARSSPPKEEESTPTAESADWTSPQPTWKRRDYEFAYMHFIATKANDKAYTISDKYRETEEGAKQQNRTNWDAFKEYIAISFGSGGSLPRLLDLVRSNAESGDALMYLAKSYEEYEEFEKAAMAYDKAAGLASTLDVQLSLLGAAALAYRRAQKLVASEASLARLKALSIQHGQGEAEVLDAEYKLAEFTKNLEVIVGTMERQLELNPSDINTRFSLAYKYSEGNSGDLSAFHYLKIPFAERTGVTWNNIGVARDELDLNVKAVLAFRKSEELGETLAMSNLANKLLKAGFLSEAQTICDSALKINDYHKNLGRTLGNLKNALEDENKKEEEILTKAKPISDFYRDFGGAVAKSACKELPTQWKGPDCLLQVSIIDENFIAKGSYEQTRLGLRGLMFLGIGSDAGKGEPASVKYTIEYRGTIKGMSIVGNIIRKRADEVEPTKSLLASGEELPTVLFIVDEKGKRIKVLEKLKTSKRFYELTAIPTT